jgi:F-type H+-transporting ATPase subunit c
MRKLGTLLVWTVLFVLLPLAAFAEDGSGGGSWGYALGAGLAVGLAGLGCGIGQGLTAGNTTAGIARNPGAAGAMFTNFILGMVLIESIAIYGLVIAFLGRERDAGLTPLNSRAATELPPGDPVPARPPVPIEGYGGCARRHVALGEQGVCQPGRSSAGDRSPRRHEVPSRSARRRAGAGERAGSAP